MGWPPRVGELLPGADEATGVRDKLERYSLNRRHPGGGGKANGFEVILGITAESIDYLEAQIYSGVKCVPLIGVRHNPPFGHGCIVDLLIQGIGERVDCVARVRTAWILGDAQAVPRLTSAYIKP